jgi:integrase
VHARLVFLTRCGFPWVKLRAEEKAEEGDKRNIKVWHDDAVTKEIRKLGLRLGIHRPGLNFYSVRHAFETIGGDARDQVAVDHIMGHARDNMASASRERISDERLRAVVEPVRAWLFAKPETQTPAREGSLILKLESA